MLPNIAVLFLYVSLPGALALRREQKTYVAQLQRGGQWSLNSSRPAASTLKNDELKEFAYKAAGLAYSMAPGNYKYVDRKTGALKAKVPKGWILLNKDQVNKESGSHIFLFKSSKSGGIVVAIRGTDLPSNPRHTCGPGCESDLKADWELFDQNFIGPKRELDGSGEKYIEDAVSMVQKAKEESNAVLVTGHSLGAALAVIAGARVGGVAVRAFSAPPFARHLPSKKAAAGMELVYSGDDPVYLATKKRGGFGGASPCVFSEAVHPGCRACGKQTVAGGAAALTGTVWADTKECTQCWPGAHFLSNYANVGSC